MHAMGERFDAIWHGGAEQSTLHGAASGDGASSFYIEWMDTYREGIT